MAKETPKPGVSFSFSHRFGIFASRLPFLRFPELPQFLSLLRVKL